MCNFIQLWLRSAWDYSKADGGGSKQWHWIPVIKTHLTEICHFKHSYMFFPDHFRSIISLATSRDSKPPSASLKEERGPKLIGGNANWTSVVITRVRGKAQEGKFCDSINRELGNSSQGLEPGFHHVSPSRTLLTYEPMIYFQGSSIIVCILRAVI
jgi:hypothetical protein